jgi:hypothetical protein
MHAVNTTINPYEELQAMNPQIEDVTIPILKPEKFIAEMTPNVEVNEYYEERARRKPSNGSAQSD